MSTFSQMAEEWLRENMPAAETKTPLEASDAPQGMSIHEPDMWRDDFSRWLAAHCIHREGRDDSSGVGCLWGDFCDWAIVYDSVPCLRSTFEVLLVEAGFELRDGMVLGLLLRSDFEAVRDFQDTTEYSAMPARAAEKERMPAARMPAMPAGTGYRIVSRNPKPAPVKLSRGETVTNVPLFIDSTLRQLNAKLNGKSWQAGHWPLSTLLERLAAAGCVVELADPRKALQ